MTYRAEIDGLRAIAVISVILYHAQIVVFGRDLFEGGFIGVDIFFVISGYLITRIILTELEETNKFNFIKFYERRARRILPMMFLVIGVCILLAWDRLQPMDLVDYAKSALSAIGFVSNFFFYYSTTEYGADSAFLKPLLHTWSLSVEEQFYIFIPIIIIVIWKFSRTSLLTVFVGMLLMSIQLAEVMDGRDSQFNYFLPFSRFWDLLVGSALASIELKYGRIKNPLATQILPIVGLFLIAHSVLFLDLKTSFPSLLRLMPIVGVTLILVFCSTNDIIGKILSFKPLVGIGLISYSLYLWHFPIFAFSKIGSFNPTFYNKVEYIALAFVLSIISYYLIEKPFRNRTFVKPKLFSSVLIIVVSALAYINYNFILNKGYSERLPPLLSKNYTFGDYWKIFKQNEQICYGRLSEFCKTNKGKKLTSVYAFGDSMFSSMSPQLVSALGERFNYTEANLGDCPFILDMNHLDMYNKETKNCSHDLQSRRFNTIQEKNSIIIIGGRFPLYLSSNYFDNKEGGLESGGKYWGTFKSTNKLSFEENFKLTLKKLLSSGHHVVLIYPMPEVGVNVTDYIINAIKGKRVSDLKAEFKPLTTSYWIYKERSEKTFQLFDSIQSPNIYRVYPHTILCDKQIKGRCVTHDNKDVFYVDHVHPSTAGSEIIVELMMKQIEKAETNIRKNF